MLTPELAQCWLTDLRYESNRPIRDLKVRRMIRVHLQDRFPQTYAIHCTLQGKDNRNLDSQHRCRMVIDTGKPLPIRLDRYDVPEELSRRQLWKSIDRGDARRFEQAIHADEWDEAGYRSKTEMVTVMRVAEIITGKLTVESVREAGEFSFEDKSDFAADWASPARGFFDAMAGAPNDYRDMLTRKLTMAVLLPLFSGAEVRRPMGELIDSVAHNRNLQPNSAGHRLFLELQRYDRKAKGRSAVEFMRRIAYCCTRHIEGLPCQKIPQDIPVALPGTDIVVGKKA